LITSSCRVKPRLLFQALPFQSPPLRMSDCPTIPSLSMGEGKGVVGQPPLYV
jgi:hypothetical protein